MFRVAVKSVLGNKLRFALTAVAVVVGVAFVAGVFVLTDSINRSFEGLFGEVNEGIAVYVNPVSDVDAEIAGGTGALGGPSLDEALLDEVLAVDGVGEASGFVAGLAVMIDAEGERIGATGPPTLGFSFTASDASPIQLADGRAPAADDEVVVDRGSAQAAGLRVGDSVEILFVDQAPSTFEVVGVSRFGDSDNLLGATTASFTLERAQALFGKEGRLDQIAVVAAEGSEVSDVALRDRVVEAVGSDDVEVVTGEQQQSSDVAEVREGLGFITNALLAFAGIALFVGSFIVVNTFTITVAQRTREFGLLRAVGAGASQVRRAVLVEAVVVGLFASVTGLGLGVGLAALLQTVIDAAGISLPQSGIVVEPRTWIASFVVGTGVTVLASILPARRASRIAPIEALRGTGPDSGDEITRRRTMGGLLAGGVGVALLLVGLLGGTDQPLPLVGGGTLLTFVGVALLAPYAASPVAAVLGSFAAHRGVPGRLARRNAQRNPQRTASTASALMIGVALVAFVSIFAASAVTSVNTLFEEQFRADLSIQADTGFGPPTPVPSALVEELRGLDELDVVASVRASNVRIGDEEATTFVASTSLDRAEEVFDFGVTQGALLDLEGDTVFIDDEVVEDRGLGVGDTITADFARERGVELEVVGVFENEELVGARWLVSNETLDRVVGAVGDLSVAATVADGVALDDARAAVEGAAERYPSLAVRTTAEVRDEAQAQVDGLLNVFIVLLLLAVVVALIGIINTLALSVFERTREIGLLRAVGMSRSQARSMIRWESVIVSVFGALLGIAVGSFFGWAMVRALAEEGISELAFPAGRLASYVLLAALAGVAAAVFPARRAANLDILDAVTDE